METLELFNIDLSTLFNHAGLNLEDDEIHILTRYYELERMPDAGDRVINVDAHVMQRLSPDCLAHITRKGRGENYAQSLEDDYWHFHSSPVCRFAVGDTRAFKSSPDEICVTEGSSPAQAVLYWLKDRSRHLPIIVNASEVGYFDQWRQTSYQPMNKHFRQTNMELLIRVMNCLPHYTILGEAFKTTYGLQGPTLLGTMVEEDLQEKMHLWQLNGKKLESVELLDKPGLVDERHLLALCWRFAQVNFLTKQARSKKEANKDLDWLRL